MGIFDNFKDSVTSMSQGVATKAKSTTESLKLNNQIKANERTMEKLKYQIGCIFYSEMKDQSVADQYEGLFSEIQKLELENKSMEEEIRLMTSEKICPRCGRANRIDVRFCVNCGAEFKEQEPVKRAGEKICPSCGGPNDQDAVFCEVCGSRFPEEVPEESIPVPEEFQKENICQNCGMVNSNQSKFCVKCGSPL